MRVVGIDLAGDERRPTGIAIIKERVAIAFIAFKDHEIMEVIDAIKPLIVAVDSPLTLPMHGYMREVDRRMHRLGFPVLPPMFPGMRKLTMRGMRLKAKLEGRGISVIEVHPRSSLKALRRRFKDDNLNVREIALRVGVKVLEAHMSKDEEDALLAAITGLLYMKGEHYIVRCDDGSIVLPRWCA